MKTTRTFNGIDFNEMKSFLEEKYLRFNTPDFISSDPISIPRQFTDQKDIEISAFLTATIAWGRRDLILRSANELIRRMGDQPFAFITEADDSDLADFSSFYYRTFNGIDCTFFLKSLKRIYSRYGSIENVFSTAYNRNLRIIDAISGLRSEFFSVEHERRSQKHFADITRGAAGKRLNMFIRWMVRNDNRGVDFGIWKKIPMSELYIPLDLHSGNIARKLGLLNRNANDWKAVEELTGVLRNFDPEDPVKYDFALFGLGVNEEF